MDQLSQRSSSERTQFMSREDLDQEGSLDLDHDHYLYQDQDQYPDQEAEHQDGQKQPMGAISSTPTKALELKVKRWIQGQKPHREPFSVSVAPSCQKAQICGYSVN